MSESSPTCYAWCDAADRVDAFAAALFRIIAPGQGCTLSVSDIWLEADTVEEAVAVLRANFFGGTNAGASSGVRLLSGRRIEFTCHCFCEESELIRPGGPLTLSPFDKEQLLPKRLEIALGGGPPSVAMEAALVYIQAQPDVEDFMLRFCAPDATLRVTTGGCTEHWFWGAPVEIGATYHANAAEVARDLALSFVHLHDGDTMRRASGLSLSDLHGRVDAAPAGARVAIKGGGELSREAVLAALAASPATLLDALEASAFPDEEWLAAEPRALETIEASKQGAPTHEVDIAPGKHVRWLRRHAPYHVRRLPSGGVMLATYPYRTLWSLWSDALYLLGIAP